MSDSYTLIVEGSLWLLIIFSVITWSLIVVKGIQNYRLGQQNKTFSQQFWQASDLNQAAHLESQTGSLARLAQVGFDTLSTSQQGAIHNLEHNWDRQDLLERHLRQQIQRERRSLENGLAVLASIGSTAPFVGLFGTVFGIIHALSAITSNASASIEIVAGPIGEALIATGIGIAVAIPAVLAYNFFIRRLKLALADLDDFGTDFVSLAQKIGFRLKNKADTSNQASKKQEVFA